MKKESGKRMKRLINNRNKKAIMIGSSSLILIYLGASAFFINHFYFGSKINGIDVSGKTVKQAEEKISSATSTYTLDIKGRDGAKGKITGEEIGLAFNKTDKVKEFKDSQNPLIWVGSIFTKNQLNSDEIVVFNKELLKQKLNKVYYFNSKELVEPKNVSFEYTSKGYKIVNEVNGNKIKPDAVYESVSKAILNKEETLDLDKSNCYEKPKYTTKSKETNEVKNILDKYTNLKITHKFGDSKEVVDGSTINKWLYVDENLKVAFDEKEIRKYVDSLASKYNTYGKTRSFATSMGKTVQVYGGSYGWIIDKTEEIKSLIEVVKGGKDLEKEPVYAQKAISHAANDIGNTYVEINFSRQHMWFYKNGALITQGDVVTGNISQNFGTPIGTYPLNYKQRKATLKGENYKTEVDFWMPFNGNIGIHDATWRNAFGGNIYRDSGSHGCINSPYSLANAIFENITAGTPVVCYNE